MSLSANYGQADVGFFWTWGVERAAVAGARRQLVGAVADLDGTLHGALLSRGRRCSSEGCHCRRGELHGPYPYLSVYEDGRSRTIYVPAPLEPVVAGRVAVTQRNDVLLSEISQINVELLRRRALE